MFANQATKPGAQQSDFYVPVQPNADLKFSKISGDQDFHLMISKDQEEAYRRISDENNDLRDCLRLLQREMTEIVCLKNDMFTQRFKAEHGRDLESEEKITAKIEAIRDELFNLNFEETGRELIQKFKVNFQRLREFMSDIDRETSQLAVFNQRDPLDEGQENDGALINNVSSVQ